MRQRLFARRLIHSRFGSNPFGEGFKMAKSINHGHHLLRSAAAVLCASAIASAPGCSSGDDSGELKGAEGSGEQAAKQPPNQLNYTLFEAGPVRPVAVLPGGLVAVTNVPDDRVELFRPHGHGVKQCGSIKV